MRRHHLHRHGFTLTSSCWSSSGSLAVLVAILLPAVQQRRGGGPPQHLPQQPRRQLGLAITNYESTFRPLPEQRQGDRHDRQRLAVRDPAARLRPRDAELGHPRQLERGTSRASIRTRRSRSILPYMDGGPIFNSMFMGAAVQLDADADRQPEHRAGQDRRSPLLLCPPSNGAMVDDTTGLRPDRLWSDRATPDIETSGERPPTSAEVKPCRTRPARPSPRREAARIGAWGWGDRRSGRSTDGTSNTILPRGSGRPAAPSRMPRAASGAGAPTTTRGERAGRDAWPGRQRTLPQPLGRPVERDRRERPATALMPAPSATAYGPPGRVINNSNRPMGGGANAWSTKNCGPNDEIFSFHTGGAQGVFGDGAQSGS